MTRKLPLALLLVFVLLYSCKSQSINKTGLDSFFVALNAHNQSMGSIAISSNGKIVYQKAIGYSQINGDDKTLANIKTKYRVGSISKMFTAVMIFQLIEEGKLTLHTTLDKYYPQLPNANKITIAEMMNHHSGLYNFTNDSLYAKYKGKLMSETEMAEIFTKEKPDFEPGLKAEYSNTNFVLLGYIIEKITGKSYSEELKKRITSKIGLEDTYYGGKANPLKNEAYSYNYVAKWEQLSETDMSTVGGAGAIVSTPTDLVKFIDALFADKLISGANLENMEMMKDNFGMAMIIIPFEDKKGYGHNGGIDGFLSQLAYFPVDKLAIAYTANGVRSSTTDIVIGALSIYYNKPFVMPEYKTIALSNIDLDKYLGNYTSSQVALKIAITKNGTTLIGQATGQNANPLDAMGNDKFLLKSAGAIFQFDTTKHTFTLSQRGTTYLFTKVN
ncbi:serine hydrolase domain-containing protein [Mucilaginibacter sp. X4EP1]|uniref:serine hydrolase domain-containing protein n=1 Tax=Mucilaginibacter sp. X4EP1 TaxID=2723092 RepID=UPI002168AC92|nr:serine hydrolase domain-containing protein [Mucilaginibacter sp. X4EP1]MCS3812357.1 CubicO group peptidase (beta-lactamase class C family) [Mucilaginibacter sp. X4EP1]